jgi:hypothetical protein
MDGATRELAQPDFPGVRALWANVDDLRGLSDAAVVERLAAGQQDESIVSFGLHVLDLVIRGLDAAGSPSTALSIKDGVEDQCRALLLELLARWVAKNTESVLDGRADSAGGTLRQTLCSLTTIYATHSTERTRNELIDLMIRLSGCHREWYEKMANCAWVIFERFPPTLPA